MSDLESRDACEAERRAIALLYAAGLLEWAEKQRATVRWQNRWRDTLSRAMLPVPAHAEDCGCSECEIKLRTEEEKESA